MHITTLAAWLLTCTVLVHSSPLVDKELWMSTPELSAPKHVRYPQPPSGAHVPAPKDHPYTNEEDGVADFNRYAARANTAPGYQYKAPTLTGVKSVLDPNAKSPLDTGAAIVYKAATHPLKPDPNLYDASKLGTPLPTNKWWQNLMLDKGADPIHTYPYRITCLANSSTIGLPQFSATATSMTSSQIADWSIGDATGALTKRLVSGADALGVNVTWSGSGGAQMDASFYKGMAFTTFQLTSMAPVLQTIHAITSVKQLALTVNSNGASDESQAMKLARSMAEKPSLTQVALNDGSQWLVVSKPAIQWTKSGASSLTTQSSKYTGFVQLAHMGDKPADNLNVLQQYAGTFPTEGSVTYAQVENNQGTGRSSDIVMFYRTNTDSGGDSSTVYNAQDVTTSVQLLTFVLPHHVDMLPKKSLLSPGLSGYRTTKGPLTAVAGNIITYSQPLTSVAFEGTHAMSAADTASVKAQLTKDMANTKITADDPYFFGKSVAKVARLYQIAEEVGDMASATTLGTQLVGYLKPWLATQSNSDTLLHDTTWGGIVSTKGLSASSEDFGQGWYNDHHFHYGYFAYACAILAKHDINTFASLREPMTQLLRDYANPSYADQYFPFMRHFDPYDGHSWAAGLFSFGDGRNQESTGEAINAYYGAYLLATALGFTDTASFYEIILNMEATSARRYWHPMRAQAKQIYMDPFIHNAVGIMWASKADYLTFFGQNPEYIYGIQMIPFTPATTLLLDDAWVKEAWCPDGSSCTDGMKPAAASANNNGWAQFLYTAYSKVDRATALPLAEKCTPDDGNTLTNVLYWIATCGQQTST
ncbi:hypothetical protein IW140_002739 [Coemansia sp. RSA 1813]|nr:hypothetical protein EV178_003619 [Coemansia sp. RSA 1646]KAJ1769093.1 hypothetical protein LPJ74_004327 [Coemansia sp. RSA 1843]KAJ2088399.1 hypothetical protein IW138_004275 [Coemansia sp. RSA 986]KAJ2213836.1 hypothetical protein EV179_003535 [Coemansia sp. RSA 487]KAJ2569851.1 hypothetical protein IW140_002739 [Coemansia sp. RSA 1813]